MVDLDAIREHIQQGCCTPEMLIILQLVSEIEYLRGVVSGLQEGCERLKTEYCKLQSEWQEHWEDANA